MRLAQQRRTKLDRFSAESSGGRRVGDYKCSKAMLESGLTWDEAAFTAYLRDPKAVVKGTKIMFAGLKNDKENMDAIAYLKGFGAGGTPR